MGSRQPRAAAEAWLAADPDPHTRAGLEALLAPADRDAGAAEELRRLFEDRLRFGTAGLRAPLGAGPARMNRVVVRSATAAVMATLPAGARVVVGHDARRNSDVFAADAAACVAAAGGEALVLGQVPTPVAAHAVVDRAADAGIVITASHNPPGDNGYKLYDAGGVQIVPPTDAAVEAHMAAAPLPPRDVPPPSDGGSIRDVGADAVERYLADIARRLRQLTPVGGSEAAGPPGNPSADRDPRRADVIRAHGRPEPVDEPLRVVYTPLHGVGAPALLALFERLGLPAPVVVASQAAPDGGFPTVAFPNPEEPGALDAAHALAGELGADLVIANDPDADRLAVAVPDGDGRRRLTGDELGALLADRLLRHPATGAPGRAVTGAPEPAAAGAPVSASAGAPEPAAAAGAAADDASAAGVAGKPALVATTVVSSQMLRAMASAAGVRLRRDAYRLQVDRPGRRRATGAPAVRLRGGARLRRVRRGPRQGRHQRRRPRGATGRRAARRGIVTARAPRRTSSAATACTPPGRSPCASRPPRPRPVPQPPPAASARTRRPRSPGSGSSR